jgi:asparagine synthase (glutamine-hydrolysing)
MSGIAGLVRLDGKPVDRDLLGRMTAFMQFRGSDAQETWLEGRVGFGHAMLRTTFEARGERQPFSLDGRVWIVADARVDGRSELRRKLRSAGRACPQNAHDAELILHAYHAWGEDCVGHILGDFAFAVWDGARDRLFCARDHFGVKPFFYARAGGCFVFSNTVGCVRAHPQVSDALNDLAIADFLLFGVNQDAATTAFADIQRLPPAHRLSASRRGVHVERYWALPSGGEGRAYRAADCVEAFTERFEEAVADRLRGERIGVLMSGGLDSTAVASVAQALLAEQEREFDLRAYTCVYERLFEDEERQYSQVAAGALGIPIRHMAADDYALFEKRPVAEIDLPEPVIDPLAALYLDQAEEISSHSRVVLTGWDGDALLSESARSWSGVLDRAMHFAQRVALAGRRALSGGGLPRPDLRARLKRMLRGEMEAPFSCPNWLNPTLVEGLDLSARWQAVQRTAQARDRERPQAHRVLTSPLLTSLLESYDPGVTRIPMEARHPLLDVRLVEFLVSLPAAPWCVDKKLLRTAMRGRLPESIRLRPKTLLAGDPVIERLQRPEAQWIDEFEATPALGRYVLRAAVPSLVGRRDQDRVWSDLRPVCLNQWLKRLTASKRAFPREEYHEVA